MLRAHYTETAHRPPHEGGPMRNPAADAAPTQGEQPAVPQTLERGAAMPYRNILVPYDRSESAKHALRAAFEMASHEEDAHVTALFVAPTPEFESGSFMVAAQVSGVLPLSAKDQQEMLDAYLDHRRKELTADLDDLLKEEDAELGLAVVHGKPSKVICDYVEDHDVDLIVMGCRGLDAVRGMIGSVSAAVLRSVECPVLVVK